jgi:nitrite reductase/ring-hydroxylating ferredoxin subunit/uncharacterized membrane protein
VRSRAHVKAHPIHPALVPFPFAFLWGAALFDVFYLISSKPSLTWTAGQLTIAGVAAGLLAAIPGVIDYLYTVPPRSSARTRATKHALGNSTAMVLFLLSWFFRNGDGSMTYLTLGCEVVGAAVLGYSGLLGGELVIRNMISVNHRYANAGKWREETLTSAPGTALTIAGDEELKKGQMKLLWINGRRIALGRTSQGYCAFEDRCTHRGGSLAGGVLIGDTVQCLWHGSQFDVCTGAVKAGPAKEKIRVFKTRIRGEDVTLVVPDAQD